MSNTQSNALLSALPLEAHSRVTESLTLQSLQLEQVLHEQDSETRSVYFPVSGIVSLLTLTEEGESIEAALIGREGVVGFWLALGVDRAKWQTIVQGEGEAWVMPAGVFRELLETEPDFRTRALGYCGAVLGMATQSIACNRFHELSGRTARWLLLMHDRAGRDDFRLTHQLLATMLGVHRPAVTIALRTLPVADIVEQTGRGALRILNRSALEQASCECYQRATGMAM